MHEGNRNRSHLRMDTLCLTLYGVLPPNQIEHSRRACAELISPPIRLGKLWILPGVNAYGKCCSTDSLILLYQRLFHRNIDTSARGGGAPAMDVKPYLDFFEPPRDQILACSGSSSYRQGSCIASTAKWLVPTAERPRGDVQMGCH